MCRYISKSVSGHQPCKTRIINDRWMELNDDSVRPCQPPSRTIKQFLLTTLYIDLNQRKPCHLNVLIIVPTLIIGTNEPSSDNLPRLESSLNLNRASPSRGPIAASNTWPGIPFSSKFWRASAALFGSGSTAITCVNENRLAS